MQQPSFETFAYSVTERFLRYVQIDTQSDPNSTSCPSTEKQKNLGRLLVQELLAMGLSDAELDSHGYVYATLPSNVKHAVPVICFCSHMDTSPDCSGAHVKPIVHKNYQGQDLILPMDPLQIIKRSEHPKLSDQIGNDLITADGTTLLGADNKAGLAEIMDAVYFFTQHPEVPHGTLRILFTPDEEIGRGADRVDIKKLGAHFGYTIDGESRGHIENETFSADRVDITISGYPTHPGFAKNKMQHALKIAAQLITSWDASKTPEATEGREPFIHPTSISGGLEEIKLSYIVRAFEASTLTQMEQDLEFILKQLLIKYPKCSYTFNTTAQYRNMKSILDQHPEVVAYAEEAIRRSGMQPCTSSIRGGTDGSRLSFMGLPCPNIFAGEHAIHSKHEWVSVQDMQKAVQTIVNLSVIWSEHKTKS